MTKSDLRARPVFHRQREAIEAHLTVVFAAPAIARHLRDTTGVTIKRLVRTLKPLRTVTVRIGTQTITAAPAIGLEARAILDRLPPINAPGHYACASQESFFSHLKTEMYHHHDFPNHMAARTAVMEYIESWYNRRRPHANNQGLPPARALTEYQNKINQVAA